MEHGLHTDEEGIGASKGAKSAKLDVARFSVIVIARIMRPALIRFLLSAAVVFVASSPFIVQGAPRSAATAPWLWAFLLEDSFRQQLLPTSMVVWWVATAALLAIGASGRVACFIVTGWCVVNALVAYLMNFQVYAALGGISN